MLGFFILIYDYLIFFINLAKLTIKIIYHEKNYSFSIFNAESNHFWTK